MLIGELDHTKNEPLAIKLRYMLRKKGVRLWLRSWCCVHVCALTNGQIKRTDDTKRPEPQASFPIF